MRNVVLVLSVLLLVGCGTVDYRDTTAAVDASPQCVGVEDDAPGAPVPDWCKREQTATWRMGDAPMPAPVFSGDDGDD